MNIDLTKTKTVYCIGVGGVGISALAQLLHSRGIAVSGLNDDEGSATLVALKELGIQIEYLKDFTVLPVADAYVYSDAWLFRGPEILAKAEATGKPVLSYFEALGAIAREYSVIAIAGTHGKTTTTAMTGEVLEAAAIDPTMVVGSIVKRYASNFREGHGPYLVVEADEYMRHLLHLDVYKDLADIEDTFSQFVDQTSQAVVCDPNDPSVRRVIKSKNIEIVDYMQYLEHVPKLSVPGEHNRKDAAAALAVADYLGIPMDVAAQSLAQFKGTWRRLELKGATPNGTPVYDDYAHHPTEVRASLSALRELYPRGSFKVRVLFQPHLYSRTKALFADFATAFGDADEVCFLPIYFAREESDPSVSSELLAAEVAKHVPGARAFATFAEAEAYFKSEKLGASDVFVTMGAGQAYTIGEALM